MLRITQRIITNKYYNVGTNTFTKFLKELEEKFSIEISVSNRHYTHDNGRGFAIAFERRYNGTDVKITLKG